MHFLNQKTFIECSSCKITQFHLRCWCIYYLKRFYNNSSLFRYNLLTDILKMRMRCTSIKFNRALYHRESYVYNHTPRRLLCRYKNSISAHTHIPFHIYTKILNTQHHENIFHKQNVRLHITSVYWSYSHSYESIFEKAQECSIEYVFWPAQGQILKCTYKCGYTQTVHVYTGICRWKSHARKFTQIHPCMQPVL